MDVACNDLFSSAGFPKNQHVGIRSGDLADQLAHIADSPGVTYQTTEEFHIAGAFLQACALPIEFHLTQCFNQLLMSYRLLQGPQGMIDQAGRS